MPVSGAVGPFRPRDILLHRWLNVGVTGWSDQLNSDLLNRFMRIEKFFRLRRVPRI